MRLPSATQAAKGAELALANSHRHLRCSTLLADSGEFGVATAHLVLAMEEAQKAYTLALVASGIAPNEVGLKDMLHRHDVRHRGAFLDTLMMAQFDMMKHHRERLDAKYDLEGAAPPPNVREEYAEALLNDVRALTQHSPDTDPTIAAFDWFGKAANRKNRGFYVDYADSQWLNPGDVDSRLYEQGLGVANRFLELRGHAVEWILSDSAHQQELREHHGKVMATIQADPRLASLEGAMEIADQELTSPAKPPNGEL